MKPTLRRPAPDTRFVEIDPTARSVELVLDVAGETVSLSLDWLHAGKLHLALGKALA